MESSHILDNGALPPAGSLGALDYAALVAFVGAVAFCALLACVRPRTTFCAEKMHTRLHIQSVHMHLQYMQLKRIYVCVHSVTGCVQLVCKLCILRF